jgi:hypothetical protein
VRCDRTSHLTFAADGPTPGPNPRGSRAFWHARAGPPARSRREAQRGASPGPLLGRLERLGAACSSAPKVTSGAPTEAANNALLINERAYGREVLSWTQDGPAVFVSVSLLRSGWRDVRHSVFYVMCKPADAYEVPVPRALLGGGGTQQCASQPRYWRRDAARPRGRSDTIERAAGWPGPADGHAGVAVARGVLGRRGREAGSGRQPVAPSLRQAEGAARNYVRPWCWRTGRWSVCLHEQRRGQRMQRRLRLRGGAAARLPSGVDGAAGESCPGGVCLTCGSHFFFFLLLLPLGGLASTGAGRSFAHILHHVWWNVGRSARSRRWCFSVFVFCVC